LEDRLGRAENADQKSPHEYVQLMTEYSINDREDLEDEDRDYFAANELIQSQNKNLCMPDFGISLGKKAKPISLQDGSMKATTVINGSSNLFLPPEVKGPACSLAPEFK